MRLIEEAAITELLVTYLAIILFKYPQYHLFPLNISDYEADVVAVSVVDVVLLYVSLAFYSSGGNCVI